MCAPRYKKLFDMEFSPPVNVKAICANKDWKAVRTQRNILQSLAGAVSLLALNFVKQGLGAISLYTPEEVSVACGTTN